MNERAHASPPLVNTSLEDRAALQEAILNSANYAIISTTVDGIVTTFNATAERLLGYTASEVIGRETPLMWHDPREVAAKAELVSRELQRPVLPNFEAIVAKIRPGQSEEGECTFIRKDGSRFPVWLSVTALKDSPDHVAGYLGVITDITERKKGEVALQLSEERFANAFQYAAIGMALVSLNGHWLKVNEALCTLVGYSAEELLKKTFQEITHPEDLEADLGNVRDMLEGRIRSYHMEKRYFHKQGHEVWVRLSVSLVRNDAAQPLYFISQIEDITESKQAMARQRELMEQAQTAERSKSEFLATMSHEIRTPINGVIGMTSVLAETELTEMQRDCLNTIQTSGESLFAVINDILDFSKIESNSLYLESRRFNVEKCVEETIDLLAAQSRSKGTETSYFVDPEISAELMGDAMRLRQILVNLVGNAVKFTTRGEVSIEVKSQGWKADGCHVLFSVSDTGIGIPAEMLGKLFHSFQQVDASTSRRYGGTGLGLAISKRLTELMDGTMWVESTVGQGSTFFFTAVFHLLSGEARKDNLAMPLQSRRALLIGNDGTGRRMLEKRLTGWGMATVTASIDREAFQGISGQAFDVIVLDFPMTGTDGLGLARDIQNQFKAPLIMLAPVVEAKSVPQENSPFTEILKPVRHSVLLDSLQRLIGEKDAQPEKKEAAKRFESGLAASHPLRILLAEDNVINQKVVQRMLTQLGYKVEIVVNGLEVLKAVEKQQFDLILMDIQMPEMDGIEAMQQVRSRPGTKATIVALTAEALAGDRERFLGLGFDGYLSKPLQPKRLQDVLKLVTKAD